MAALKFTMANVGSIPRESFDDATPGIFLKKKADKIRWVIAAAAIIVTAAALPSEETTRRAPLPPAVGGVGVG